MTPNNINKTKQNARVQSAINTYPSIIQHLIQRPSSIDPLSCKRPSLERPSSILELYLLDYQSCENSF